MDIIKVLFYLFGHEKTRRKITIKKIEANFVKNLGTKLTGFIR